MLQLILWAGAGAGLGALTGYFGRCSSGGCPLTSTWWRGSLYGALLGTVFYYGSGRSGSAAMNQSSENVKLITETQFDAEVVQCVSPVVVDFYAPWCGPCKMLAPLLDQLAGTFEGRIKFAKVNVDHAPELAGKYEITGVPTLALFQGGRLIKVQVGMGSPAALKSWLQTVASAAPTVPITSGL